MRITNKNIARVVVLIALCACSACNAQTRAAQDTPPTATAVIVNAETSPTQVIPIAANATPTKTPVRRAADSPTFPSHITLFATPYVPELFVHADPTTNVAEAQTRLAVQGLEFDVIVVSPESVGVQGEIYRDLVRRNFRATTGPDEGFDTAGLACHPNCVFVRDDAVNQIGADSWTNVLRHEQRHMVQAANNPNIAREFRMSDGMFTTYAAFLEACADDGIFVADATYHSSVRMPRLEFIIGAENMPLLARACQGDPPAYVAIVNSYDSKAGETGAFARLFPPYR